MSRSRRSWFVVGSLLAGAAVTGVAPGAHAAEDTSPPVDVAITDPTQAPAPRADNAPTMAAGVLVKTTTKTASSGLVAAAEDALPAGVEVTEKQPSVAGVHTTLLPTDERVTSAEAEDVAAELRQRPDVVWAMPNYILTAQAQPPVQTNDPAFKLDRVRAVWDKRSRSNGKVRAVLGSSNSFPVGGYSSKAPYLWRATQGAGEVVAVIDTGITDHPDLPAWNAGTPTGRLLPGYDFVSRYTVAGSAPENTGRDGDGWDPDATDKGDWTPGNNYCGRGIPATNSSWHGTHVAGIIGAASNSLGIVGVAPRVSILPVRALGICGGTSEDIVAGILWAAGLPVTDPLTHTPVPINPHPADVINLSLGGYALDSAGHFHPCNTTYAGLFVDAIKRARAAGSVIVAAAGNDGWRTSSRPSIPATCSGVVAVGATSEYGDRAGYGDDKGKKAVYSNYGGAVDISAPGGDYFWDGRGILSTFNSGTRGPGKPSYGEYIGTSMATPVVAAGAALIRSLGSFTPAQTQTALKAAVQSFPRTARSSQFKPCSTLICGAGILSLNKVTAPINRPVIRGSLAIGEPLTAAPGWWNATPKSFAYLWLRNGDGISGATRSTYTPTTADVGKRLSVRVAPAGGAFAAVRSTSSETSVVRSGPVVTLTELPGRTTYGVPGSAARVAVAGVGPGGAVVLRRGSTVVASGRTDKSGQVRILIPGRAWKAGTNPIRAAFLGDASHGPRSSASTSVRVAKAPSRLETSLPTSIGRQSRATLRIRVTVPYISGPTGQIRVYDGGRRILTATLYRGNKGARTLSLPRLSTGRHSITVVYAGTGNIRAKTSGTRRISSR